MNYLFNKSVMSEPVSGVIGISLMIKHGTIAAFGAVAHAIRSHREGKSKGLLDFLLLSLMSSFSGVVFALLALNFFGDGYLTLAAAGAGGYLGVEGLTVLAYKIRDSLADAIK